MSRPVYLTQEIRRIEQANATLPLMERAGTAAAELAVTLLSDKGKDVLILAGPGNNGGDAKVVARLLKERFFRVSLATNAEEIPKDIRWNLASLCGVWMIVPPEKFPKEAEAALALGATRFGEAELAASQDMRVVTRIGVGRGSRTTVVSPSSCFQIWPFSRTIPYWSPSTGSNTRPSRSGRGP